MTYRGSSTTINYYSLLINNAIQVGNSNLLFTLTKPYLVYAQLSLKVSSTSVYLGILNKLKEIQRAAITLNEPTLHHQVALTLSEIFIREIDKCEFGFNCQFRGFDAYVESNTNREGRQAAAKIDIYYGPHGPLGPGHHHAVAYRENPYEFVSDEMR